MDAEQEGRDMVERADALARRAFLLLVLDAPEVLREQPDQGRALLRLPYVRIALSSKPRHRQRDSAFVLRFVFRRGGRERLELRLLRVPLRPLALAPFLALAAAGFAALPFLFLAQLAAAALVGLGLAGGDRVDAGADRP